MVSETWLRRLRGGLWNRHSHLPAAKATAPPASIGVLAFEVARLMSKLTQLWRTISDDHIVHLRQHALHLPGVRKLVSDDDDHLLSLALAELLHSLAAAAVAVARLGRRCATPLLHDLYSTFHDHHAGVALKWQFNAGKMKRNVKKMERLAAASVELYREMEVLGDGEQVLRRMRSNGVDPKTWSFVEFEKKVMLQKMEVKCLKKCSLWNRSFDYAVRLMARSIFTIFVRIQFLFGASNPAMVLGRLPRSHSMPAPSAHHSMVHSSDHSNAAMFVSGPLGRERNKKSSTKVTAFGGGVLPGLKSGGAKEAVLNAPPSTLGASALALHYANVVILIEKMFNCPHMIAPDTRDDLYSMLPTSIRSELRSRLRYCGKQVRALGCDEVLAMEWSEAMKRKLEWLAPLAHNMVRWQSERSYEQQLVLVSNTKVLLLQTLHFSDQEKTEAAITELLVGLNYVYRYHREIDPEGFIGVGGIVDWD